MTLVKVMKNARGRQYVSVLVPISSATHSSVVMGSLGFEGTTNALVFGAMEDCIRSVSMK